MAKRKRLFKVVGIAFGLVIVLFLGLTVAANFAPVCDLEGGFMPCVSAKTFDGPPSWGEGLTDAERMVVVYNMGGYYSVKNCGYVAHSQCSGEYVWWERLANADSVEWVSCRVGWLEDGFYQSEVTIKVDRYSRYRVKVDGKNAC